MGKAAGTAVHAEELFKGLEPTVKAIPAEYAENYNKKTEQAAKMSKLAAEKAKTVFFEKIPAFKDIKMPDQKNFVKYDKSADEPLYKEPIMKEVLRYIIPPQVRKM